MKKIYLVGVLLGLVFVLCSCQLNKTFYTNEDFFTIPFDNIESLGVNDVTTSEQYEEGTFLLGYGSFNSKTEYCTYTYVSFRYKPLENAYSKQAWLVEDEKTCIVIIETDENHYYISQNGRGYVGGKEYELIYRVYIPVGAALVSVNFNVLD